MVFGLPAIVSDEVGCGPDLVIEDETGWVFSGGVDGLAAAMRRAITHRDRLPAMGVAARERVTTRYMMDVATDGLLAAVRSVVR